MVGAGNYGRKDDLYFVRPGLGFDMANWLNCEFSADMRKNDSSLDGRSFDVTTAMVKFNVLF